VLSLGIEGITDGGALLMALDLEGVAASGGSACLSGAPKSSHVMRALYGPDDAHATVRFSLGRGTSAEDVERAVRATATVVALMREAA
jgi:cysteine desulfurase